jgi:hypothetical protein
MFSIGKSNGHGLRQEDAPALCHGFLVKRRERKIEAARALL